MPPKKNPINNSKLVAPESKSEPLTSKQKLALADAINKYKEEVEQVSKIKGNVPLPADPAQQLRFMLKNPETYKRDNSNNANTPQILAGRASDLLDNPAPSSAPTVTTSTALLKNNQLDKGPSA
jgi:hypothetical protein